MTPSTKLDTPCREWIGARVKGKGYGRRRLPRHSSETKAAHRWVWELINGPVPPGMIVMHRCDNPPCFRYDHLRLGTISDNNADRASKHRNADVKGERNPAAKLTAHQVAEIRDLRGRLTQREIAARFDINRSMVSYIHSHKSWRHT